MFAIVDCNNFYASCERLFQPHLAHRPIVVLSNNDGCVIARSNEARALGIKMGEPYFKVRGLCQHHQVAIFSSNYTFYGDMSARVHAVLQQSWDLIEIYSIDEAFLKLDGLSESEAECFCQSLRTTVMKQTGIPVSIGIGKTKTLAKLANHVAKRKLNCGVFNISSAMHWLKELPVAEIWGVGGRSAKKLKAYGVLSADDLKQVDSHLFRRRFNVLLERTILELRGVPCIPLEELSNKQTITCSRSFGQLLSEQTLIAHALSHFCERATEKLRQEQSVCGRLRVFIYSNRYRKDLPQHMADLEVRLSHPTDDSRLIVKVARQLLTKLYRPGISYKKVGVILSVLTPKAMVQESLFAGPDINREAMTVFDKINQRYGTNTIALASSGFSRKWRMRRESLSKHYTTSFDDLPLVRVE